MTGGHCGSSLASGPVSVGSGAFLFLVSGYHHSPCHERSVARSILLDRDTRSMGLPPLPPSPPPYVPQAIEVALGTSGETATFMTTEAGGYTLNGEAFETGSVATTGNGNMYTVMIDDDGMFTAEFVQPPALSIPLGISGSSVEVRRNEDLTFSALIDGEWVSITPDTQFRAPGEGVYKAVFSADGTPIGVASD